MSQNDWTVFTSQCCHKTRLRGAPCPDGNACPYDQAWLTKPAKTSIELPFTPEQVRSGTARLTTDSAARKDVPIFTGVLDYFPDAIADVARLSKIGNDKHNAGQPLHWSRDKSSDHADCLGRHMLDRGTVDTDGVLHDAKVAWRALAQLQLAIERLRANGESYP